MINYFELFGLQERFHLEPGKVKKKFYELSRKYHPDRFVNGSTDALEEAEKMSAIINNAYETLHDKDRLMSYILRLFSVLEEEEKYNLSPDFLMEMMELNEAVSDAEMSGDEAQQKQARQSLAYHLEMIETEILPFTIAFDDGNHSKENLLKLKEFYFRKKYLLRVQERITKFALP